MSPSPSAEELASFSFGGVRARPRKGIEGTVVSGQTYLKPPGSLGSRWPGLGISVNVECCEDCEIYILDRTEQVQIADCNNCRVVIGPCVGSVFFLDCSGCTLSVAAKQLRLRDVSNSELRVYAPTKECVVVESSSSLTFRAWDVAYPTLDSLFAAAGWDASVNHWSSVYDFSPSEHPNFGLMPQSEQAAGRWSELVLAPEGLSGGSVEEIVGSRPITPGCECPCAAADGAAYRAGWYEPSPAAVRETAEEQVGTETVDEDCRFNSDGSQKIGHFPELGSAPATSSLSKLSQCIDGLRCLFGWAESERDPFPITEGKAADLSGSHSQTCAMQ